MLECLLIQEVVHSYGGNAKNIAEGALAAGASEASVLHFDNNSDAGKYLLEFVKPGDVLLVKGSRGMKMEEIVNLLTTNL